MQNFCWSANLKVHKFWGLFCYRKSENFLDVPVHKSQISWVDQTVDRKLKISWVGQTVDRKLKISWVGQTVDRKLKISWVGQTVDRKLKISWVGKSANSKFANFYHERERMKHLFWKVLLLFDPHMYMAKPYKIWLQICSADFFYWREMMH